MLASSGAKFLGRIVSKYRVTSPVRACQSALWSSRRRSYGSPTDACCPIFDFEASRRCYLDTSSYPGNSVSISTLETESHQRMLKNQAIALALGVHGVFYGDIGTSPLYTIRECFHGHHAVALSQGNAFGIMSGGLFRVTCKPRCGTWRSDPAVVLDICIRFMFTCYCIRYIVIL